MISFTLAYDMRAPDFGAKSVDLYAAALDQCAWADELGCEMVSFLEHHASNDGYLPSPIVMASAVAARTERVLLRDHGHLRASQPLRVGDAALRVRAGPMRRAIRLPSFGMAAPAATF